MQYVCVAMDYLCIFALIATCGGYLSNTYAQTKTHIQLFTHIKATASGYLFSTYTAKQPNSITSIQ